MLNNANPGHCGHCGGLMVLDRDDPGERICTNCGRSTFRPSDEILKEQPRRQFGPILAARQKKKEAHHANLT